MSVGFFDEKEGHRSSRRLMLFLCYLDATAIVIVGLAFKDMAIIGAGTGLIATILTTQQWGKSIEKGKGLPT